MIRTAQLSTKINQLEAQLGIVGVRQVKLAKPRASTLVAPHPRKNAEFAFVIALVLGAFAAFFLGRFNRRLRTLGDIEAALHQEVLTSLPKVRTPVVRRDGWMSPSRHLVEPLRRLQTTLMLEHLPGENRHSSPRSILFVSAEPGDEQVDGRGRPRAGSQRRRRAGDADRGRLPPAGPGARSQHRTRSRPLRCAHRAPRAGRRSSGGALGSRAVRVSPSTNGAVATAVVPQGAGAVWALAAGPPVPNPPALLAGAAMADLVRAAAEDYDRVLIDAPGPLAVSDVMPLLGIVEAIVLVARVGHAREQAAVQLHQLARPHPDRAGARRGSQRRPRAEISKYGAGATPQRRWPGSLVGR